MGYIGKRQLIINELTTKYFKNEIFATEGLDYDFVVSSVALNIFSSRKMVEDVLKDFVDAKKVQILNNKILKY